MMVVDSQAANRMTVTKQELVEETPNERLVKLRASLGLSLKEFAIPIGMTARRIQRIESGELDITRLLAADIAKTHKASSEWLFSGKGKMMLADDDDEPDDSFTFLPLLSLRPSAGRGSTIDGEPKEINKLPFDKIWLRNRVGVAIKHLVLFEVVGDSMVSTLHPDDLVMIDKSASELGFRDGVWVLRIDDSLHIKRVQHLGNGQYQAISDNSRYRPFALNETAQLIGRMVWSDKRW